MATFPTELKKRTYVEEEEEEEKGEEGEEIRERRRREGGGRVGKGTEREQEHFSDMILLRTTVPSPTFSDGSFREKLNY